MEQALNGLRVRVPVDRPMRFWYPLEPTRKLKDDAKFVGFDPPEETLAGERIHQWIGGARRSADKPLRLPDLDRIERQQILIGRLLEEGYDFLRALGRPDSPRDVERDGPPVPCPGSRQGWSSRTYPKVEPVTIDDKKVLVRRRARWLPRWAPKDGR